MADEYQAPQTMMQAATSPNAAGALQQLLMSRLPTPEQEQWQRQGRQDQLEQYQGALRADPYQGYSALDHGLYSWIGNMGKSQHPAYAAMQGIAAGGKFMGDRGQQMQKGEIAASKLGYEDALKDEKMGLEELKTLASLGKGRGANISPEKLAPLWTSAQATARAHYTPEKYPNMTREELESSVLNLSKQIYQTGVEQLRESGANMPGGAVAQAPAAQAVAPVKEVGTGGMMSTTDMTPEEEALYVRKMRANTAIINDSRSTPEAVKRSKEILAKMQGDYKPTFADPVTEVQSQQQTSQPSLQVKSIVQGASQPRTALEAGYTDEARNAHLESPFAMGLMLKPVATNLMNKSADADLDKGRAAFLNSDSYKDLDKSAGVATDLIKVAQRALENPNKGGAAAGLIDAANRYAAAVGVPLSADEQKQLSHYATNNQDSKYMGLIGQLMQRGVQTDADFQRIIQAAFDPNMRPSQRTAVLSQAIDNLNTTLTKANYLKQYTANPASKGQEGLWQQKYEEFAQNIPVSVVGPSGKFVTFDQAAKEVWRHEGGAKLKPTANDTAEERQRKHDALVKVLNHNNAIGRAKLAEKAKALESGGK